jgi:hypothetical protein
MRDHAERIELRITLAALDSDLIKAADAVEALAQRRDLDTGSEVAKAIGAAECQTWAIS